MKKYFTITILTLCVSLQLFSQKATIKGVIRDTKNEPVFSASVIIDIDSGLTFPF